MLFGNIDRTDRTPKRPGESRFKFLNRSGTEYFGAVRELMEDWLSHVPAGDRSDLVGALRADDRQHESAFWELYLHEAYVRAGCQVQIHPDVPGTSNHPDFHVTLNSGEVFYLEAVGVGQDGSAISRDQRLQDVYRVLEAMKITDFILGLDAFDVGPRPLATGPLRAALRNWLTGLDPQAVGDAVDAQSLGGFSPLPSFAWEKDGWSLMFHAFPVRDEVRGTPRRALGIMGAGQAHVVDNVTGLRRVLQQKCVRYGVLNAPFVTAVQSNTFIPTRDYEVDRVLYGLASGRPTDPRQEHAGLVEEGFWRTSLDYSSLGARQQVGSTKVPAW
jgi:hypothetical protein